MCELQSSNKWYSEKEWSKTIYRYLGIGGNKTIIFGMKLEHLKKNLSNVYIDFGSGFRFGVEDVVEESHDIYGKSIILKIHPGSIRWFEIEHSLKNNNKNYEQFLAEKYELEDEIFKEIYLSGEF